MTYMIPSEPELTPLSIFKIFSKRVASIKKCFKEKVLLNMYTIQKFLGFFLIMSKVWQDITFKQNDVYMILFPSFFQSNTKTMLTRKTEKSFELFKQLK